MLYKTPIARILQYAVIVTTLIVAAASCKKEDVYPQALPSIINIGLPGGKDTILTGEQLSIHPTLTNRTSTTYEWKVNGTVKSTDSVFVFTSDAGGDFTIEYNAINTSGKATAQYLIHVWEKYENGILLVNEGWFGHDNGNVNFYRYGADTIEQMVYHKENPGKELGVTTQYASVWEGKLYLVSKQGPFVVTNAKTLKETGRIDNLPANGRAFLGLDANKGLISTANGIYPLDLASLTVGTKINGITGETGTLRKKGNYIYAISQSKGLLILNQSDYSITKTIPGITMGLVKTADGSMWVAGGKSLVKINTATLDTNLVVLPFTLGNPWVAWNDGTLTASSKDNTVFIARTMSWGAGGTQIYKYIAGDATSLSSPFATLPAGQEFYGSGARYNPTRNELVVTTVKSGYGQNYSFNNLYFYDVNSGALKKTVSYEYFYFPALMLFQ